jgi:hypothetical protein
MGGMKARQGWVDAGILGACLGAALVAGLEVSRADDAAMAPVMMERSFLKPELPMEAQYVPGTEEKFPRLRFADGQISLNDRCPVRHAKLNPKMAPVYVNGKPIGFC